MIRAKMLCSAMRTSAARPADATAPHWSRVYEFAAAYDQYVPEDQRYATATPSASMTITVDNPAAQFEVGQHYYLDFTPIEPAAAAA
jgi:hypothetical protein